MSGESYARMSTDDLIQEFIRVAKTLRSIWTFFPKFPERTPERRAMSEEINAIAAELCARKPVDKLRPLFDDESDDVRSYAAGKFYSLDPEWASATLAALGAHLSTKDVMAYRAHARKRSPARPSVKEMSTDQLVARFEDAGIRQYATRFLGGQFEPFDVALSNRIAREMWNVLNELKSRGALAELAPLLDHPNIAVRRQAAASCLPVVRERAIATLEAIEASRDSIEGPRAGMDLVFLYQREKADKTGSR